MQLQPSTYGVYRAEIHYQPKQKKLASLIDILVIVSEATNTPISLMRTKWRKREIVEAKQIYCYMAFNLTTFTWKDIGFEINTDHSNAICGKNKMIDLLFTNDKVKEKVKFVEKKFYERFSSAKRSRKVG